MARLPARNLGPRRSASPGGEEPEEPARPKRSVTRVHASAVGILLVLVLSVVAVGLLRSKPTEIPAGAVAVSTVPEGATLPGSTSSDTDTPLVAGAAPVSAPALSPSPTPTHSVQVHVAGQVRHPGVYTVSSGARVADAIKAAGGMASGAHPGRLNLAAPVCDGCQIWIPSRGDGTVTAPGEAAGGMKGQGSEPSGAGAAAGGSSAAGTLINLNTAGQSELESIDGVGPVMAGRIMAWRQEHGRFTSVDQLREISGIGPKTFEKIKPHVSV